MHTRGELSRRVCADEAKFALNPNVLRSFRRDMGAKSRGCAEV